MIEPQVRDNVLYSELPHAHTFKMELSAKAFHIFSSQLYEYKIRAILRELSCNAVDAQKEAKSTRPFQVKLPNFMDPYFYIRDFGTGISEENMYDVFTVIFKSTKDQTNDYTGMLGLGSKSPFSYTESFTIISYQDGIEKTYIALMGNNRIPTIDRVHEGLTDEPDGLKIQFGVNEKDFREFEKEAKHVFLTFFDVQPELIDAKFSLNTLQDAFTYFQDGKVIHDPVCAGDYLTVYVVQGNIAYPVNLNHLNTTFFDDFKFKGKLFLRVNIGDITFTPSREQMEKTDENVALVHSIVNNPALRAELEAQIDALVEPISSQYQASEFYSKEYSNAHLAFESRLYEAKIQAKGFTYTSFISFDKDSELYQYYATDLNIQAGLKSLTPGRQYVLYMKDNVRYAMKAIRKHINDQRTTAFLIVKNLENQDVFNDLMQHYGEYFKVIYASELSAGYFEVEPKEKQSYFKTSAYSSGYSPLAAYGYADDAPFYYLVMHPKTDVTNAAVAMFSDFLRLADPGNRRILIIRRSEEAKVKRHFPAGKNVEKCLTDYLSNKIGVRAIQAHFTEVAFTNSMQHDEVSKLTTLLAMLPEDQPIKHRKEIENLRNKRHWNTKFREVEAAFAKTKAGKQYFENLLTNRYRTDVLQHAFERKLNRLDHIVSWYKETLPMFFFGNIPSNWREGHEVYEQYKANLRVLLNHYSKESSK